MLHEVFLLVCFLLNVTCTSCEQVVCAIFPYVQMAGRIVFPSPPGGGVLCPPSDTP